VSLLTDSDLEKILVKEEKYSSDENLIISPFSNDSLTPVGYDLRVGETAAISTKSGRIQLVEGESFTIPASSTALVATLENIGMPRDRSLSALIESKVTKVSKGLSHISTTVDPDWKGNLLIAIHNHSSEKFKLSYGETFCTIVFIKNLSPSNKPCDKQPGRLDVFLEKFEEESARAAKKRTFKEFLPPAVVLASAALGYLVFGNTIALAASVAVGVAISQYIQAKLQ